MKQLHGEASATVGATAEECLTHLAAIDGYAACYPDVVRHAEVLDSGEDGLPTRAQVTLNVSRGPLQKTFKLLMDVDIEPPSEVRLVRIPHDPSDEETFAVTWRIEEHGESRRIRLAIDASLNAPRFLPLGNIGDELAGGFLAAMARALTPEH